MEKLKAILSQLKAKLFAPDKIVHLKGGLGVLAGSFLACIIMRHFGVHPVAQALILAGFAAGAAIEYSQRARNNQDVAEGLPARHGIEVLDVVASALPCWVAAAVIQAAMYFGKLPAWLV